MAAVLAFLITAVLPISALAAITTAADPDWQPLTQDQVLATGQAIEGLSVEVQSDDGAADFGDGCALGFIYPSYGSPTPVRTAAELVDAAGSVVSSPDNNTSYTLRALSPLTFSHEHVASGISVAAGTASDDTQALGGQLVTPQSVTVYGLENIEDDYPWTHIVSLRAGEEYTLRTPQDIRWGTDAHHYTGEPAFTALAGGSTEPTYEWTVTSIDSAPPQAGPDPAANGITATDETTLRPTFTFTRPGTYELLCTATNFLATVGGDEVLEGGNAPHLSLNFTVRGVQISPDPSGDEHEQTLIRYGLPGEIQVTAVPSSAEEALTGYWTVTDPEGNELDEAALREQLSVSLALGTAEAGVPATQITGILPTDQSSFGLYTFTWNGTDAYAGIGPLVSKVYVVEPEMRISGPEGNFPGAVIIPGSDPFTLTAQIAVPGDPAFVDAPFARWRISNAAGTPGSETVDYAMQLGITDANALRTVRITIDPKAFTEDVIIGTPYILTCDYSDWSASAELSIIEPPKTGTMQITTDAADNTLTAGGAVQATLIPKVWGLAAGSDWSDWTNGSWTLPEGTTAHQWGLRGDALTGTGAITIAPVLELLHNQPEGGYVFIYTADVDGLETRAEIAIRLVQGQQPPAAADAFEPGEGSPITISGDAPDRCALGMTVSVDGTTAAAFLEALNMSLPDDRMLRIVDADGEELADDAVVGTGCDLQLIKSGTGEAVDSAAVVIAGDVLGTGVVDIQQVVRMDQDLNGLRPLEGIFVIAGDFNGSGGIDIADLVLEAQILNGQRR